MKKVFLDNAPRRNDGCGININWEKSNGCIFKFIYNDIEGGIEIVDYNKNTGKLGVKYLDRDIFYIATQSIKRGSIGKLIGVNTGEFKIKIGTILKDEKRDIIITDNINNVVIRKNGKDEKQKSYKYTCNKCGWTEGWMIEGNIIKGYGCACCVSQIVVPGINDISTTDYWMIKLGMLQEDAKRHTAKSNKKVFVKCPDCGRGFKKQINVMYTNKSLGCTCGDGVSYPEKVVISILSQLNLNFKYQLTSKNYKWCNSYRYDFIIDKYIIIEVNGIQHYKDSSGIFSKTLKEQQSVDSIKKELALSNGIEEYIVIDCRKSELEFIKNNILISKLAELYDLSIIDWNKCGEYAMSNLSKKACNMWNNGGNDIDTLDISNELKVSKGSVVTWLNKWEKLGKCTYKGSKVMAKTRLKVSEINKKRCNKPIEIFKDGKSNGVFASIMDIERRSKELFGVTLSNSAISNVAKGKRKTHKGYTFKYIPREELYNGEIL